MSFKQKHCNSCKVCYNNIGDVMAMQNNMKIYRVFDSDDLHLHYAKGPSIESGREFHTYHEMLYIPEIEGKFITENGELTLTDGCLLLIPGESFHHLIIGDPEKYTRFCINFEEICGLEEVTETCMQNICVIKNPGDKIISLFSRIPEILSEKDDDKRILIHAVFSEILVYLKKVLNRRTEISPRSTDSAVYKALKFINRNYCSPINLNIIAKAAGISQSSLSHIFKRDLNTSVYKYITDKRMTAAQRLLKSGLSPSAAAFECGYSDYTVFYRAYKKYYGISPEQSRSKNIFSNYFTTKNKCLRPRDL